MLTYSFQKHIRGTLVDRVVARIWVRLNMRLVSLLQSNIHSILISHPSTHLCPSITTNMDPSYVSDGEEEEEAATMAAAMGFSSFGAQRQPSKKRKFNPTTDAFVEGQELASLDKGGKKGQGSGGNTIPLGKVRVLGAGAGPANVPTNYEEIDLGKGDEEEGPNYIDTTLPAPPEGAREMQERIDAILASLDADAPTYIEIPGGHRPGVTRQPQTHDLPQRPAFNDTTFMTGNSRHAFSDTASMASSLGPSQRGQRNEFWYVDYYDPSFNENPWARLEEVKGLKTNGTWLDRR